MKKISTLFQKDPKDLGRVINVPNPDAQWVFDGEAIATRKYDGTATAIIDNWPYARFDAKPGREVPEGAIPCQDEGDETTGHHPHWVRCDRDNPSHQWHFSAFDNRGDQEDGTYELCGPKVQGNPENFEEHVLVRHGSILLGVPALNFEELYDWLDTQDIEGIVFHHKTDGRMSKLRKRDFGLKRNPIA